MCSVYASVLAICASNVAPHGCDVYVGYLEQKYKHNNDIRYLLHCTWLWWCNVGPQNAIYRGVT